MRAEAAAGIARRALDLELAVDRGEAGLTEIEEYVRGGFWHTNTIENYFSILKRGITGVYQHVGQQHLKRYLGEFDFRYNTRDLTDWERTGKALRGIEGKRLTYGGSQTRLHVAA